jgi:3-mercaptopyruvate sulfurtransferase SseA
MHRKLLIVSLAVILLLMFGIAVNAAEFKTPAQLVTEAKASVKEVSVQDLKKMIDNNENIVILDIRDRDEYEKQHIPGAIHMSRGLVDLHVDEIIPDKNATIVVY